LGKKGEKNGTQVQKELVVYFKAYQALLFNFY